MNTTRRTIALAAAATLLAAACGDDDDGSAAPATEGSAAAATSPPGGASASSAPAEGSAAVGDRSAWPEKLVMGAVPAEESTSLQESYDPLLQVLEEELGIEVEFFQATDYAGIIEGQIAGNVHLAQYGPFSYVIARNNGATIEPVGALIDGPDATPGYRSYGITRADNDEISSLEDFAGKNVCFVDPGSTSGFLYPSAGLLEVGIDPETGVSPVFAGGHDASVISVKNGDCDAGFAFDTMVDVELIESGDIAEGEIETVWESELIAGSPLAVASDLPADLLAEIRRIVLEEANSDRLAERGICADAESCTLSDEGSWGWAEVDDAFFDGVRAVCETTQAEACKTG